MYYKVYGCDKHGTTYGKRYKIEYPAKKKIKEYSCFFCKKCNMILIDTDEYKKGTILKSKVPGKQEKNIDTPVEIPKEIFVYSRHDNQNDKCCNVKIKKLKPLYSFIMPNGNLKAASGCRYCPTCEKVYLSSGSIEQFNNRFQDMKIAYKYMFEKPTKVIVDNIDDDVEDENVVKSDLGEANVWEQPRLKNIDENEVNIDEEVLLDEDDDIQSNSIENLNPANRVACAYYDANISYNPYQYLPWLKVFVNGSNRLLISDEVGLGKTIEAGILIMDQMTMNANSRILIVCPAFLKIKWRDELKLKFFIDAPIYDGKMLLDDISGPLIVPLSQLKNFKGHQFCFDFVIIDEVHYFRNMKSRRFAYMAEILDKSPSAKYVFMSATPINNSGYDYSSITKLFGKQPDRTNTTKKEAYIDLPQRNINDVFVDLSEDEQEFYNVTDELDPFSGTIYRHIGSSCLHALSEYAYVEADKTSETKQELRNSLEELLGDDVEDDKMSFLSNAKNFPLIETDTKLQALTEIIDGFENGTRIVIFSHYINTIKYLENKLKDDYDVGYIYANTVGGQIEKIRNVQKFKSAVGWFSQGSEQTKILICSDTCKEGIDLDMSNVIINYDLPFNPSILEQRIGRIDRKNQKKDMLIYNFHVNNTYDDRLHFILASKLRIINFYADYHIGNPLNIVAGKDAIFDNFIRYFNVQDTGNKKFMSKDDFKVLLRVIRKSGINIKNIKDLNPEQLQEYILSILSNDKEDIEKWFSRGDIKNITDENLREKREELSALLGFPEKIKRKVVLNENVKERLCDKANNILGFRKRMAHLIKDYDYLLKQMEETGEPMILYPENFKDVYNIIPNNEETFLQNTVIEIMRNEGAEVYEL